VIKNSLKLRYSQAVDGFATSLARYHEMFFS
jgi:hypothetical protein